MNPSDRSSRPEPNRVLGFPISRPGQVGGPSGAGGPGRDREEPQHVAGMPVDWFGSADLGRLRLLAHPVREYRRWARQRGPGGTDKIDS